MGHTGNSVSERRGLHLRNLLALTSALRFEFPVSAVVERSEVTADFSSAR